MCYMDTKKRKLIFNIKANKIPIKQKKEKCVPISQYL